MKIKHVLSFVCISLILSLGIESQVRVKIVDGVRVKIAGFGAEKVGNNEFETAGIGGADVFAYWSETTGGTTTINQDNVNEYSGANCCRCDVDAVNSGSFLGGFLILGANKRYKLSLYYYNSLIDKTARITFADSAANIYLQTDKTWGAGVSNFIFPNALSWTKWEIEFVTHGSYANYRLTLSRELAASSSIYFDQIKLQEVPAKITIGLLANTLGFKTPWLEGKNILEERYEN